MAHTSWIYPFDLSGEDEARQALEKRPYFMLQCSKINRATYVKEVSKKDIPDIPTEGFLYLYQRGEGSSIENYYFVLDRNCAYLLGVFSLTANNSGRLVRIFFQKFEEIKKKADFFIQIEKEFKKNQKCIASQQIVQSLLDNGSNEYKLSFELLSYFKQKYDELKIQKDYLQNEIKQMIHEYVMLNIQFFNDSSNENIGINIEGTIKNYLDYFLENK